MAYGVFFVDTLVFIVIMLIGACISERSPSDCK